jgi:beta-lactamase superfamily II metal-dependent hydrolase
MKLTVFQSDKGDCLLLASEDERHHMLIDGGMRRSYKEFVAPALMELASQDLPLDIVCISHIDQDHIGGVLQLLDDIVAWRVHDFQIHHGNPKHPAPGRGAPPHIRGIWHNGFRDLVPADNLDLEEMFTASAAMLSSSTSESLRKLAYEHRELAASIPEAIKLSHRVDASQLGIPLNAEFGSKLAFVRSNEAPSSVSLGMFRISIIGPFEKDLNKLRKKWGKWLSEHQAEVEKLQKQARRDAERLGTNDLKSLMNLMSAQQLGDRSKVTPPNLASLMLLVEEDGKTLLLTGDGHWKDILQGLRFHQKLDDEERIHVDILKVPHHGSEHNINEEFACKVTADHYVFCGNGEHENPNLHVLEVLIDSRIGNVPFRSRNPQADGPFKLWFNSSESATQKPEAKEHMRCVRELVEQRKANSRGRLGFQFLEKQTPSFEVHVR